MGVSAPCDVQQARLDVQQVRLDGTVADQGNQQTCRRGSTIRAEVNVCSGGQNDGFIWINNYMICVNM